MFLLGLYIGSLLFGAILIGASLAFGKDTAGGHDAPGHDGPDHDVEHDVDHDADHAGPGHGGHGDGAAAAGTFWLPLRSVRFWTFFLAAFGGTGALLWLASVHDAIALPVAIGNGLALGWGIAWVFEQLRVKPVSGHTSSRPLIGVEAEVVLPIRPGGRGKIAIQTAVERVELPATSRDGAVLDPGARVLVAAVEDGVADVSAIRPRRLGERATEG